MCVCSACPGPTQAPPLHWPAVLVFSHGLQLHSHLHLLSCSVSNGISIHWHGFSLRSPGQAWFDGAGFLQQCPIASGQQYTLR